MEKERFKEIDGLKFICCISILIAHYAALEGAPISKFKFIFENYAIGLPVFFTVAGFCTAYNYEEKLKQTTFVDFFLKRFISLFPATFISNIIGMILFLISGGKVSLYQALVCLTVTNRVIDINQNGGYPYNGVTWYVGSLFVCYMIYYVIAHYSKDESAYILLSIAFFLLGWIIIINDFKIPFLYLSKAYGSFFSGVLLCKFQNSDFPKKRISIIAMLVVISIVLLACFYDLTEIMGNIGCIYVLVISPALVLITINISWIKKVCSSSSLVYCGKYSFSIFLTHQLVYKVFRLIQINYLPTLKFTDFSTFLIVFVSVIVISILWYHLIEKKLATGMVHFLSKT